MKSQQRGGGRLALASLVLALGIWGLSSTTALARGGGGGGHGGGGGGHMGGGHMGGGHMGGGWGGYRGGWGGGAYHRGGWGYGGLGYFGGLGYGLGFGGYGYGYPGYGYAGMGYSYPYSGYGYGYGSGYPYSGTTFVNPLAGFGYSSAYVPPAVGGVGAATAPAPVQGRFLGIDEEPVVNADGRRAIKVAKVYPGTPAETAGLQVGDVLNSVNGYLTEQRGNLSWIIANAAPNNELTMNVRTQRDGKDHTITARLP